MITGNRHKIYGIIGSSLKHSLSPLIHNHLFNKNKLANTYTTFEIDQSQLEDVIRSIKTLSVSGANVTFPYKENIIPYLDKLDASSEKTGAVNTIKNTRGELIGYNTDIFGVRETINNKLRINIKDKTVVLLGAGGAARACLIELIKQKPSRIIMASRDINKVNDMLGIISRQKSATKIITLEIKELNTIETSEQPALLINSTSARSSVLLSIINQLNKSVKSNNPEIFDLNYGSQAIPKNRQNFSNRYFDGLYMLTAQAAASFHIWTGIRVKPDDIYKQISRNIYLKNSDGS